MKIKPQDLDRYNEDEDLVEQILSETKQRFETKAKRQNLHAYSQPVAEQRKTNKPKHFKPE